MIEKFSNRNTDSIAIAAKISRMLRHGFDSEASSRMMVDCCNSNSQISGHTS